MTNLCPEQLEFLELPANDLVTMAVSSNESGWPNQSDPPLCLFAVNLNVNAASILNLCAFQRTVLAKPLLGSVNWSLN